MSDHYNSEVWTEKYRPKVFDDMVGQEEIIKRVNSLTNSMNIPHMVLGAQGSRALVNFQHRSPPIHPVERDLR